MSRAAQLSVGVMEEDLFSVERAWLVLVWCGVTLRGDKAGSPRPRATVSWGKNLNYRGEQGTLLAVGWGGTARPGWGAGLVRGRGDASSVGKFKKHGKERKSKKWFFLNGEDRKVQVRVLNIAGLEFKCWGLGWSCWAEVSRWPVPYQQTRRWAWGQSAAAPGSAVMGHEWHLPSKQNTPLLCRACSPRPRFRNPQLSRLAT